MDFLLTENIGKLYESLYQNSNDSIILHQVDGTIIKHNKKFKQLIQTINNQWINENIHDYVDIKSKEKFRRKTQSLQEDESIKFECNLITKAQKKLPVKISSHLIKIDNTLLIQSVIKNLSKFKQSLVDIKKKDMKIQMSKKKLMEAQRIAKVGNWELDLTTNKLIWSHEVYNIFNLDPNTFEANYEAFLQSIHPDDVKKVNHKYMSSLITKLPYSVEHRIITKDGTLKYVEEKCQHITDDDDNIIRSMGTVQDITSRKQVQVQLKETEKSYKSILENMEDIYLRSDLKGSIFSSLGGTKKHLDYLPCELINTNVQNLYKDPSLNQTIIKNLENNEGHLKIKVELLNKMQGSLWCSLNAQYWYNENGSLGGVQYFLRNISKEVEAEKMKNLY